MKTGGDIRGEGTIGWILRDNGSFVMRGGDSRGLLTGSTLGSSGRSVIVDEGCTGEIERSRLQCLKTDSSSQQAWTKAAQQPEERTTCILSQLHCSTLYTGG